MREKLGIQIRKKFRRPRADRSSLFVFGSGQLIKAWNLSEGIVLCGWDRESPKQVTFFWTIWALDWDNPRIPGLQGVWQYVGDRVFRLRYKGGGHLHIGGDDSEVGRVSVGPFVKPVQNSGDCL